MNKKKVVVIGCGLIGHIYVKILKKVEIYTKKEFIVIAPASVWYTKQFPKEKWIEFLDRLKTLHQLILMTYAKFSSDRWVRTSNPCSVTAIVCSH